MSGRRKSWAGKGDPHQPRVATHETATHLRLTTDRYLRGTASAGDVAEAFAMFKEACDANPRVVVRGVECEDPQNWKCNCKACRLADELDMGQS